MSRLDHVTSRSTARAAARARGDDLVLRDERGSAWEVSPGFLAAEVRAGLMRRVP